MKWLDKIGYTPLVIVAVLLGLAPFVPEPHLWQKLNMLMDGILIKPMDIFDLVFHGSGPVLLLLKVSKTILKAG
ncbi:MAG: RND transporter [Acidiferrobacterales bacterium]